MILGQSRYNQLMSLGIDAQSHETVSDRGLYEGPDLTIDEEHQGRVIDSPVTGIDQENTEISCSNDDDTTVIDEEPASTVVISDNEVRERLACVQQDIKV